MKHYDYLIVGAGLFGAIVAHELKERGKSVLVVERKDHIGGTAYTEMNSGICVHKYGAHIFRTSELWIWNYVTKFVTFRQYVHTPIANYKGEMYNLPFNMNTFSKLWNISTPDEARKKIESQCVQNDNPSNLEEFALSTVGTDIYNKLIKGYTEKQWGVKCNELPADTMSRIPIRYTYDNNYYRGKYFQGIPELGYTTLIQRMLVDIDIEHADGREFVKEYQDNFDKIIYTGCIDEFYDYEFGELGYRSLDFTEQWLNIPNFQGASVVNYTDADTPYTRIIEHKHFMQTDVPYTIITYETPKKFKVGDEPFYPMLDETNQTLYKRYKAYSQWENPNIIFCGKLGSYKYTDMEDTVKDAFNLLTIL